MPVPRSLFVCALLYGGMVCMAGVLGAKQVALGPLAVEAGLFAFLTLVMLGSAVAELHGRPVATALVRVGFLPLIVSLLLIRLVLALPADPGMYPPLRAAFPVVLGQSGRMMLAGLVAYGTSQTLNVLIFARLDFDRARLKRAPAQAGTSAVSPEMPHPGLRPSPEHGIASDQSDQPLRERTGRLVWARAMVASAASQVVDTVIFITVAFAGERPILPLMAGQMLAKVTLSVALVPWGVTALVWAGRRLDAR